MPLTTSKDIDGSADNDKNQNLPTDGGDVNENSPDSLQNPDQSDQDADEVERAREDAASATAKPAAKKGKVPTVADVDKAVKTDQQRMREVLEAQPKVRMIVPLESGEKLGAQEMVSINGYQVWVPKGRYVNVPEQIADMLSDYLQIPVEAAQNNEKRLGGAKSKEQSEALDLPLA